MLWHLNLWWRLTVNRTRVKSVREFEELFAYNFFVFGKRTKNAAAANVLVCSPGAGISYFHQVMKL